MNIKVSLSESELEELDDFLMSEICPDSGMLIDTLDGFLAAIVLTPATIMASRWLPWVWDMDEGEEAPHFESVEEANHFLGLIMRYYNSIVYAIDQGQFEPLFLELYQESGSEFLDAEGWCEGFMFGVELFPEHWQTLIEQHPILIEPMMLLGTEKGRRTVKGYDDPDTQREIYETIPIVVAALHVYFRPQREREVAAIMRLVETRKAGSVGSARSPQSHGSKVGRNDPCPCGSGKKYKKCCGMGEWLH